MVVLIDLNALCVAAAHMQDYWYPKAMFLAFSLVTGQAGMLAVWGVLGGTVWVWRLPAIVLSVALTGDANKLHQTASLAPEEVKRILACRQPVSTVNPAIRKFIIV